MTRTWRTWLAPVPLALAFAAVWLAFDNPEVRHTSRGDHYVCLAPWDTVLNEADNVPGGEPAPDGDRIAARCREAGRARFHLAEAVGTGSLVLAAALVAAPARRRRTPQPSGQP